jgi:hypothetical protein
MSSGVVVGDGEMVSALEGEKLYDLSVQQACPAKALDGGWAPQRKANRMRPRHFQG